MSASNEPIDRHTRLQHFGIEREDVTRLSGIARVMKRHVPAALDHLYEKIAANPALFRLFGGRRETMAHAKAAQIAHWHTMFSGEPGPA